MGHSPPGYRADLITVYGPPSQTGFGSAVFFRHYLEQPGRNGNDSAIIMTVLEDLTCDLRPEANPHH
jgi:hypothetical protein